MAKGHLDDLHKAEIVNTSKLVPSVIIKTHYWLNSLSEYDWRRLYTIVDTNEAFSYFHEILSLAYNQAFPKKTLNKIYNTRKPWLTDCLKMTIKKKNKLYVISKKHPTARNEQVYKTYKNRLNKILKAAEKEYFSKQLEQNKSNMKRTWDIIKHVINRNKRKSAQEKFKLSNGEITCDKYVVCNKFNNFFVNIGPQLAANIENQNKIPESYLKNRQLNTIVLAPVTPEEVFKLVKSLKDSAPGYDEIKMKPMQSVISEILSPLTYVLNLSISNGIFTDILKIANVIPLYKKDDPMIFSNYRPVSLLCTLSKILEKAMYDRVNDFLNEFDIIFKYQFGFRRGYSTYLALTVLMDKLTKSMENGDYVVGVFLDFSKAFDMVNHKILLSKLYHYGIRDVALKWFQSYLENRKQYVTYNGEISDMQIIKCGVPQGSILGPLLFLIYINDLANVCKYTMPIFFADDSNLFLNGRDPADIEAKLNNELAQIAQWLKVNKLALNIDKTACMLFGNRQGYSKVKLHLQGKQIAQVSNIKFLGVILDEKLNWKAHVSYISGKISRAIGVIIKARNLGKESLLSLYHTLIYPYLTYCHQVWGSTYQYNIDTLEKLQKRLFE